MPNKPEIVAVRSEADPASMAQQLLAIARFMNLPPGICRMSYNSGTGVLTIQVTNRSGAANAGVWVVAFFGRNPETGAIWVPGLGFPGAPTRGIRLHYAAARDFSVYATDTEGVVEFTIGIGLPATLRLYALCLGEPQTLDP